MIRSRKPRLNLNIRVLAIGVIALLVLSVNPVLAQQHCAVWLDTLLDTTVSCVNEPWRDRAFGVETFRWKNNDYMMLNRGNELSIYNINNPGSPFLVDTSEFEFGTRGDSDYDLLVYDVNDEGRYGVFSHKVKRTVIFDLGPGAIPAFQNSTGTFSPSSDLQLGGQVFSKSGQQYLITAGASDNCGTNSGLYTLDGLSTYGFVECVEVGGSPILVKGLQSQEKDGVLYLYLAASNGPAHVFRADGAGSALDLVHVASPVGMYGTGYQLSIDANNDRAASANWLDGEVTFWDVSNPANPLLKSSWTIAMTATVVSLRSPSTNSASTLYTAVGGWPWSIRTFVVDEGGPDEFESTYWADTSLPHNPPGLSCIADQAGALSPDGSTLFASRNALHQVFDLSECLAPVPATASLAITPTTVFPGQTVELRDSSTGRVDRHAIWVTENGTLVSGTDVLTSYNPHTLNYTVPVGIAESNSVVAHIEVDADDLTPASPYYEAPLSIDRTPVASFTVSPSAVIVNDAVTLMATAEGSPQSYGWLITPPSGSPLTPTGNRADFIVNVSGLWSFELTAEYSHGASGVTDAGGGVRYGDLDGDSLYEYEVTVTLDVKAIAADFSWTPSNPFHTQPITLDASSSKPSTGLTYQWEVAEEGGPDSYTGCPAQVQCVIPAEALLPNTSYSVTLTASNGVDTSFKTQGLFVHNGNIQPIITFNPGSPERGENVLFSVNGVPAEVTTATWTMGGPGCDGESATQVCQPDPFGFNNCKSMNFEYSTSGSKTVSVDLVVGGNSFTSPPVTVNVASTGSCSGGTTPPPTCSYSLGQTGADFGSAQKDWSFGVTTTSGCQWTASSSTPWITVLSPTGQASGSGTVRFRVAENTGPKRVGSIIAAGRGYVVTQSAPWRAANFTMSNPRPERGEVVTFSADPLLDVANWDFGESDCRGNFPQINCASYPSGACNTIQWTFPTDGYKTVTMVLEDGRVVPKSPTVQDNGECCDATGTPDAAFTVSQDTVYAGETVYFTDQSAKAALFTKSLGFSWSPADPEIGEDIIFSLNDVEGTITRAAWDFGDAGCDGISSIECIPDGLWNKCLAATTDYATGGTKQVSVVLDLADGSQVLAGPESVVVAESGSCEGGPADPCTYDFTPPNAVFEATGGPGSFSVATGPDCGWSVTSTATWLQPLSGSGPGPGTVSYRVAANENYTSRFAYLKLGGRSFKVNQGALDRDSAPREWSWTITQVEDEFGEPMDLAVFSSTDPNPNYKFSDPGRYRVVLVASNCFGAGTQTEYVDVLEALIEDFIVGAAVSLAGANDTQWESDLRFYNPCEENLDIRIEYQPENVNNTGAELVYREFQMLANETRVFPHIYDAIPGLEGEQISGSVRIESVSDGGCKVLSASRTFNDTPEGSLGLFVPALPVKRVGLRFLELTGLIHNNDYRTNLRLVNYSDEDVWVPLTAYDRNGKVMGARKSVKVRGQSTKQVNEVATWLGVTGNLAPFSVKAEIDGLDIQAFGTVVDNRTGDSVLYMSSFENENQIWLVGVASLSGANESQWRTDMWLYNPTDDWLGGHVEFVVGDDPTNVYGFDWPTMAASRIRQYLDIVTETLGLEETRGYIVLTGDNGGPAPQVAARTYNLDPEGGTYGLNLRAYGSRDLLNPGEIGYIAGISNSSDESIGFRTNFGVLNTDRNGWTRVRVTMYDLDGNLAAEPYETNIAPGKLRQFDVFKKFGLSDVDMTGSLKIEAVSGGAVAVYATEIDNRTQDSIFIPAQQMFIGQAR